MKKSAKGPVLTVDVIIPNKRGQVLLIRRGHEPFKGEWCLPGGLVDEGETVESAALREVREEIGITVDIQYILGVFSAPGRDPRGHYVSIVLVARPTDDRPALTEEATAITTVHPDVHLDMAFDHAYILAEYGRALAGSSEVVLA